MINERLVADRLDEIRAAVARLKRFHGQDREAFTADADAFAIAEHHLRRALEALLDVGRHLTAKLKLGKPEEYSAVVAALATAGVLPPDFAQRAIAMARYRNRLVHLYWRVTPGEVHELILSKLGDFDEFCRHIQTYLDRQEQGGETKQSGAAPEGSEPSR